MEFKMVHNNLNVFDLEKSIKFYEEALGLRETNRIVGEDESYIIVYLGDGKSNHLLELTWLRDMERPYELGDNEIHLAFETENFESALEKHKEMNCVCFVNNNMGIYFICDPDGYWLEIVPNQQK